MSIYTQILTYLTLCLKVFKGKFTRAFTRPAMAKTRTVSKWMSRFLFVGRMEKKKLQSTIQEKFETSSDIEQINQCIILGRLLSTDGWNPASFERSARVLYFPMLSNIL